MKPTKIYQCSVPAGGAFPLLVQGDYFKIMSSTGPVELRGDTFGSIGSVLAGQGMRDTPFNRLEIRDLTGSDNLVSILVADAAFVDDRITGEVSVIDGGRSRTIAGGAFLGAHGAAATAGNFGSAQIWNPNGSGKRVVVKSYALSSPVAGGINVGFVNTPLLNLTFNARSKRAYGPLSSAELRFQIANPSIMVNVCDFVYLQASTTVIRTLQEPIVLPPNNGLFCEHGVQNAGMTVCWEFVEEPVTA